MKPRVAITATFLSAFLPAASLAQWEPDGIAICTQEDDQRYATIVSDGAGGAIVTWSDFRSGTHYDIFAQRLNASGVPQWAANGVALCAAANDQIAPTIAADGAGGAIVTWYDRRSGTNYDIYVQRVNGDGVTQWMFEGVALCTAVSDQFSPKLVPDGSGGAIVAWDDDRTLGGTLDVYVQRVSAAGIPLWTPNGVAMVLQSSDQAGSRIDSDGAGGAVVAWHGYRSGTNYDIFAQRVNASGTPQWTPDGVAICVEDIDQSFPTIASDGAGGAFVTWADPRDGNNDVYAQRVNAAGAVQWAVDGIALCAAVNGQSGSNVIGDGAGGAIVTWQDSRTGASDVYAQRVSASGTAQWASDGVALCAAANNQTWPVLVADGAGGAIVTWHDTRSGVGDLFAQRVSAAGTPQWAADGVVVCAAAGDQSLPTIAVGSNGGALVTWHDFRSGSEPDIFAQRLQDPPTGIDDTPSIAPVTVLPNRPNPFATTTEFEIGIPNASPIEIEVFDVVGRRVRTQMFAPRSAGWQNLAFDGRDDAGRLLPSGVYFYRVRTNDTAVVRKMVIMR